ALGRRFGRDTGYFLAAAFLVLGLMLTPAVLTTLRGGTVTTSLRWIPSLDVSFTLRLDGLGSLFALLVIGVGALIMSYCPRYLHNGHHSRTYILLTLVAFAMLGLVFSADLVMLFVFLDLTTVSSFFLFWVTEPDSIRPAMRALALSSTGLMALL